MTQPAAEVSIDLTVLVEFRTQVDAQLNGGTGPVADALKQWAVRVRSWLQERFDKNSKGGGEWPALSEKTIAKRRKGNGDGSPAILRDLGLLFAVLNPVFTGQPGAIEESIPYGVRVGFGGSTAHGNGAATISDIAAYHQEGAGHLPVREIIVTPDNNIQELMSNDMRRALDRLANE